VAPLAQTIQQKLDRLDEAFLFERSIDIDTYDRHAGKLREELTQARIDRHSGQLDELDVEGILAFAERVLPRAADLWVQASLDQRQRFQQLFFPEGISLDGNGFVRTARGTPSPRGGQVRLECGEGRERQPGHRVAFHIVDAGFRLAFRPRATSLEAAPSRVTRRSPNGRRA
jgi:hypothetical protein